jgi:hypothetical protein
VPDRSKFVRSFSLKGPHPGAGYAWYITKKAAFLGAVLIIVLLAHAWLPRDPLWISLGVPAVIAVAAFTLSGRIAIGRQDTAASEAPPSIDPPKAPPDPT